MTAGPTAFPLSVLFILASSLLILWTSWTVLLIRVWTLAHGPHGWDFLFRKSPPSPMISSCSVLYSQSNNYSPILMCQSLIPSLIVMGLLSITAAFINPFSQPNNRHNGEKAPPGNGRRCRSQGQCKYQKTATQRQREIESVCVCVYEGGATTHLLRCWKETIVIWAAESWSSQSVEALAQMTTELVGMHKEQAAVHRKQLEELQIQTEWQTSILEQ